MNSAKQISAIKDRPTSDGLIADLTFDNFVVGKANQLAHAAAIRVADTPGTSSNPLFIYGGVGLGKTHLLHAIGNQVTNQNPQAKICYIHATNYISGVVKSFQTKSFDEFKKFYSSLDLLLIDDIQFIADKPGTQQEFFYTLNSLMDASKQVVITCDVFPKKDAGIEPRLLSRFTCGLAVAIKRPGRTLRIDILRQKFSKIGMALGEEAEQYISEYIRGDVRKLEGAANRLAAYSKFYKRDIDLKITIKTLRDLIKNND